jgi:hypothetical protein
MKEENCMGLVVNTAKCKIITDEENVVQTFKYIAPDIKPIKTSYALLLGAPIGGMQSVDLALVAKLHELPRLSGRLAHLKILAEELLCNFQTNLYTSLHAVLYLSAVTRV